MISDDVIALDRQPSGQAENNDAGQDHHRYNAGDTTIETTAREMTGHGFSSDSSPRLTAACDDSSAVGQLMGRALGGAIANSAQDGRSQRVRPSAGAMINSATPIDCSL
jgi:outer membrane lipoprotein SlyB